MKEHTTEEYIQELRNIVIGFTGIDPRMGRKIEPIKPVSEEDTVRFLNKLFTQKRRGEQDG